MKKGFVALIGTVIGAILGVGGSLFYSSKRITEKEKKIAKFKNYYNMLNQWLALKQEGKSLERYFVENDYKKIAIYGMGEMGNRLYEELKGTSIEIAYAIDKNSSSIYSELDFYELEDELPKVDVIVITATFAFDEIVKTLEENVDMEVVSLEDVVYQS